MSDELRTALAHALEPSSISCQVERVRSQLSQAAHSGKLLVVGSANLPQKVVRAVRDSGGHVAALVEFDPQYWGREVEGVQVLPLDEALQMMGPDPLVLVGIWSPHHIYAETRDWLSTAGVQRILPVNAAFWVHADRLGSHYQFGKAGLYSAESASILKVYDSLNDETSRSQFAGVVQYRVTLDSAHLPVPTYKRIYFDPAIAHLPNDVVVADVGAFSGDTLEVFLYWQGTRFARFLAFEPDPISFCRLLEYRDRLPSAIRAKVECINAAVGQSSGTLRIMPTGTPGTKSSETDAGIDVSCVSIDDYFQGQNLGYIKVDVEGAEPDVLSGAWDTIERTRPVIGLSVYHAPDHIFSLPLQVIERLSGYEFLFRAHDYDGIDFVFYAVPLEMSARNKPAFP